MPKVTELERAKTQLKPAFSAPRTHAVASKTTVLLRQRFAETATIQDGLFSIYNSAVKPKGHKNLSERQTANAPKLLPLTQRKAPCLFVCTQLYQPGGQGQSR